MTPKHKQVSEARDRTLPLVQRLCCASHNLTDWRATAGLKSKWSNHTHLKEAGLFRTFQVEADALTAHMSSLVPQHWDMQDWVLRPGRTGGLRWAGKQGRGQTGTKMPKEAPNLSAAIGVLVGYALKSQNSSNEERDYLNVLGLGQGHLLEMGFCPRRFYTNQKLTTHKGFSIKDARAKAIITSSNLDFPHQPYDTSLEDAFDAGFDHACRTLARDISWGAYPALYAKLRKDRRVRRLVGATPALGVKFGPTADQDLCAYDLNLSAALELLEQIAPKPPAEKKAFLIRCEDKQLVGVQAWCASSAALSLLLKRIFNGKPPGDIGLWDIYATADEKGAAVREIGDRIFKLTPQTNA